MKKAALCSAFLLCLVLCLCSCGQPPETYTVQKDGRTFTVDTEECTITNGVDVIKYDLSKYGYPYQVKFYYPDGSSFWWEEGDAFGGGGWSDNYSAKRYVDAQVLMSVLEAGFPVDRSDKFVPCFFLLILGLVHILAPIGVWACCFAMYRQGEPDEGELIGIRILGGLILLGTAAWFWDWL